MMKRVCLTAAVMAMAALPAFAAEECGPIPIAPAFPTVGSLTAKPVEAARKDLMDTYHQVKTYQANLGSFRSCLARQTAADTSEITADQVKPEDATKIPPLQRRIADRQAIYDKTVDSEQLIATDFNTLRLGHCQRDTDPKICPQPKK
jgi:hypothetical protein